jgi:hypothetical protein
LHCVLVLSFSSLAIKYWKQLLSDGNPLWPQQYALSVVQNSVELGLSSASTTYLEQDATSISSWHQYEILATVSQRGA